MKASGISLSRSWRSANSPPAKAVIAKTVAKRRLERVGRETGRARSRASATVPTWALRQEPDERQHGKRRDKHDRIANRPPQEEQEQAAGHHQEARRDQVAEAAEASGHSSRPGA